MMFQQQEEEAEHVRVHCSTARGDIRVLQAEKAHVEKIDEICRRCGIE